MSPQVCWYPAVSETNVPSGGEACPWRFQPQQATELSDLTPQVCRSPELTEVNVPPGGEAWPSPSSPQQVTEPSDSIPQAWNPPGLTAMNLPAGGLVALPTWGAPSPPSRRLIRRI